jgi:hypothetical protein
MGVSASFCVLYRAIHDFITDIQEIILVVTTSHKYNKGIVFMSNSYGKMAVRNSIIV